MKKNGRLVAIALGSVLCASCVGGAFLVVGNTSAAETVRAANQIDYNYSWTPVSEDKALFGSNGTTRDLNGITWTWNNTSSVPGYLAYQNNQKAFQIGSGKKKFAGGSLTATLPSSFGSKIAGLRIKTASASGTVKVSASIGDVQVINNVTTSSWETLKWIEGDFSAALSGEIEITFSSSTKGAFYLAGIEIAGIEEITYDHIKIEGEPSRTEYYVGDYFSTAGLVVNGYLTPDDVNPVDLTSQAIWTIEPEQFTEVGDATEVLVIANIGELDDIASYTVNVKEPATVEYLEVVGGEDITYYAGEDFNLDGLTVIAHMSDGADVDVTDEVTFDAHEFTMEEAENGETSLSIEYRGTSTNLAVTVDFMPIENVRKGNDGAYFYTEGLVTGKFSHSGGYSIFIEDGEYGIMLYGVKTDLSEAVAVGDIIAVGGSKTTYSGLIELQNLDRLDIVSTGNEVEPTVIDNVTSSALTGWDSRYIQVSGLTKNRGSLWNGSKRDTLVVNHSSGTIGFYCSNNAVAEDLEPQLDAFFAKIEKLPFTFTGHVGWFNSDAQFNPTSIDEFSCPDYDAVMAFINSYMKPDVSQSDEGDGKSCLEWYPAAKAALEALTETQRNFFLTSDTTAAYANRYNNWAKAYGEGATSSLGTIMSSNDTAAIIALVALSSATVAAAGFMIASRRRKAK